MLSRIAPIYAMLIPVRARTTQLIVIALVAAAPAGCGKKSNNTLMVFDAGLPEPRDAANEAEAGEPDAATFEDAMSFPDAAPDAEPADAGATDAERLEGGITDAEDTFPDAEPGFPDAEPAEAGPTDAERLEGGPDDSGEYDGGVDAGNDGGVTYDANICTGQIVVRGACTDCAEGSCCNELAACNSSFNCYSEFNNCMLPCTQNNFVSVCMAQCLFSPEGVAVRNCVTNSCSAVCP